MALELDKEEQQRRQEETLVTTVAQSLPSNTTVSKEPFKIREDVFLGELNTPEVAVDAQDPYELDLENDDLYELDVNVDPMDFVVDDIDFFNDARNQTEIQNKTVDPDAVWQPKSYAQFVLEKQEKGIELDPYGFVEGSLLNLSPGNKMMKAGFRWLNEKFASDQKKIDIAFIQPTALSETQVEGRELAIGIINEQLTELGNVKLTDYENIRKAKDLWDKRYELEFRNQMDKALADSELPTVGEFLDAIQEDPETFFKQMVQEVINKPELVLVPQFAAARASAATTQAAKALGAGAKTVQLAKHTGTMAGAYGGGMSLGFIDRVAEQSTKTGEIDAAKALEQAQVDGILGIVTTATGRTVTRGTARMRQFRESASNAAKLKTEAARSTEIDLDIIKNKSKIQDALDDPATETYVDNGGNVYTFEILESQTADSIKKDIVDLQGFKDKYVNDPEALKAIQLELEAKQKQLETEGLSGADISKIVSDMESLSKKGEGLSTSDNIVDKWTTLKDRNPVVTQNYMTFKDADGVDHVLRRMTPELLREGGVNIQGIQGIDLSGNFNVTDANNKFFHMFKDYAVNATASLRPLVNTSPTAKLLIDTFDPRPGTRGRSPVYTLQENTHFKQGQWAVESNRLANVLQDRVGAGGEEMLRKHMRGVEISENPHVLEVAAGYRKLLDEARDYAKSKGLRVDGAKDFLPRYYNREVLKDDAAQIRLADIVKDTTDRQGEVIGFDRAKRSARDIALNVAKESDEAGRFIQDGQMQPVGFRQWQDVPDADLDEFLDTKFIASLDRYLNNTAKRSEVEGVFGYNGSKMDEWINKIEKETESAGRFLEEREVDSLRDLYKLAAGTYGGHATAKGLTDSILALENALKLPLVTVTSALEPTTLLFRLNESSGIRGLVNAYGGRAARKLFGKEKGKGTKYDDMTVYDIEAEAKEVGLIHDIATKERIEAMTGEGLEGLPAKINNKIMKGFMLHQWTEHTRAVAYEAGRNDLLKSIKKLSRDPQGSGSDLRRRWLAENMVDPELAVEWYRQGGSVTDPVYTAIKRGSARMANTIITSPNKFNKAKLLSSNRSVPRLVGQFKSFGSAFSNDIVVSTYDEMVKLWNSGNKVKAMNKAGALMATIGAMTYWTTYKTPLIVEGEPTGDDKPEDIALKMTQGTAGMLIPGAAMVAPLYGGRGLESGLGPTFSDVNNLVKGNDPTNIAPTYKKVIEQINE